MKKKIKPKSRRTRYWIEYVLPNGDLIPIRRVIIGDSTILIPFNILGCKHHGFIPFKHFWK